MTDISLPYDQVCEIIEKTARDWTRFADDVPDTFNVSVCLAHYCRFGHKLLRKLEEAHLAKLDQTGVKT